MNELHYDIGFDAVCVMSELTQSEIIINFKRAIGDDIINWNDVTNWCDGMGYDILCCETDYDTKDWPNYDDKTGVTL